MIKHVILWTLKPEPDEAQKHEIKCNMKAALEGLVGTVPGLLSLCVNTQPLASSNADVMLDSAFENEEALRGYAVHPAHVAAADTYVRPYTATRACMDYEQ